MRRSRAVFVACGLALIIGGQIVYTVLLASPDGARIRAPEPSAVRDRAFAVSGDAWMRGGLAGIQVTATPLEPAGQGTLSFPAVRDAVRYRGNVLFALSTWSASVELPADGTWELRAVATGPGARTVRSNGRAIVVRAGAAPREFRSWTVEHLVPVGLVLASSVAIGLAVRRARRRGGPASARVMERTALAMSAVLWANELAYQVYWFAVGGWSPASALMLQMCGLSILLLPVMFFAEGPRVRQWLFDVLYFWGIGGALQALIAPDIGASGFPAYRYFSFFLSHGLIIALTVLMALAGGMRITIRSLARALAVTTALLVPVYGVDRLLQLIPPYDQGGYFVLAYPPPTGSVVDVFAEVFGPSPRYVVGLLLMGIAVFGVLYLPWPLSLLAARRGRGGQPAERSSLRDGR
jgi:hypothetical integral membrane protein (TIGR02206 family)